MSLSSSSNPSPDKKQPPKPLSDGPLLVPHTSSPPPPPKTGSDFEAENPPREDLKPKKTARIKQSNFERLLKDSSESRAVHEDQTKDTFRLNLQRSEAHLLYHFLEAHGLQVYFETLILAGYDDLQALIEQMNTPVPLSEEMLSDIGIRKSGHCKTLLARLHASAFAGFSFNRRAGLNWSCCASQSANPQRVLTSSLQEWLAELKLAGLADKLVEAGYDDIETMRELMLSPFPITEETLRGIGIEESWARRVILGKLLEEVRIEEFNRRNKGCFLV